MLRVGLREFHETVAEGQPRLTALGLKGRGAAQEVGGARDVTLRIEPVSQAARSARESMLRRVPRTTQQLRVRADLTLEADSQWVAATCSGACDNSGIIRTLRQEKRLCAAHIVLCERECICGVLDVASANELDARLARHDGRGSESGLKAEELTC